jgi:hypothetical protein
MLSQEQLEGIFLAIGRPELTIYRNEKKHIGYEVRMRINVRANSFEFLEMIQELLAHNNVESNLKLSESKVRPKPILRVSGITNIIRLCELVPDNLPSSKSQWVTFKDAANVVYRGEHTTQEGLDYLLALKGEI